MKNRGISIIGIIVFIGVIALIVWSLNYIITKDFVTVKTLTPAFYPSQIKSVATSTLSKPKATSTPEIISTAPNNTSSNFTVNYTVNGFIPASLTVKKGQTVKFINNSSDKMWVSANPFPTSSDYPAFNEKSSVDNEASWSFTFDKTGTWFYHNHFNPQVGAKIIVSAN